MTLKPTKAVEAVQLGFAGLGIAGYRVRRNSGVVA
jgi:hypothetical protein